MSINLTDEIEVKTKKGKLGAAKQIFLEGDIQTVEKEIQDINSRHSALNTKHESLSKTVQGITATGGASTATNVTYNNNSSKLNAENVQDAIDELANKKFDKESIIVQTTGEAEDKVMSQKATSTELGKKANKAYMDVELAKKANTADVDTKFTEEKNRVDGELDKKFDKESVAQTFGESEQLVISQKAVSNRLNDLSSTISTLKKKVEDIPATIPKVVSMSESAYEALETKESDTYYMLTEE